MSKKSGIFRLAHTDVLVNRTAERSQIRQEKKMNYIPQSLLNALEIFYQYLVLFMITLFFLPRRVRSGPYAPKLSVLIPAHNEDHYLKESVTAALNSSYDGEKEIIVINDGSIDHTQEVIEQLKSEYPELIAIHNREQLGKAASLNKALDLSTGELVAVVDGDSVVEKEAFHHIAKDFADERVHCVTASIYGLNLRSIFHIFVHMQIIYQSLYRYLMAKIGANISAPGPLTVYKRETVYTIGKFSTDGFCEDTELAIRIQDHGYRLVANKKAKVGTYLPHSLWHLVRQQFRWYAGTIYVIKRKLNLKKFSLIHWFALPVISLGLLNGYIFGPISLMHIFESITWALSSGSNESMQAATEVLKGLTIQPFFENIYIIYKYIHTLTLDQVPAILERVSGPVLYIFSIFFFVRNFRIQNIIGIYLFHAFTPFIFCIQFFALKGLFSRTQYNRWTKGVVKKRKAHH